MKEWTWTVGRSGSIGSVSVLEAPEDVVSRLQARRQSVDLGFVSDLFVHPLRRRRGWANTLMDCVVKYADKNGVDLWTYAEPFGNDLHERMTHGGLLSYYARWGFLEVEEPAYNNELVRRWHR